MPLPQFLCIGAQKAGTSWLNVQLSKHPQLWLPTVKELHFFDHLYVEDNRSWTLTHIQRNALSALQSHLDKNTPPDWGFVRYLADLSDRMPFTEAWYARAYDRPRARTRMCGDITPEYCTLPYEGIEHIKQLLPAVKLIYIVRDPVERALSQLRMNLERSNKEPSLDRLLKMCEHPDLDNRGDYRTYIPRWKRHFDASRLLILPYGDMRSSPADFMMRIESHLGVNHYKKYEFARRVHETRKVPMPVEVIDLLEKRYAPQRDFLRTEFGEEFLLRTR